MYKGSNNQEQKLQESRKSTKEKNGWFRKAANQSIRVLKKNSFRSDMDLSLSSKSYTFSAYPMMEFLDSSYSPIISRLLAFSPFLFLFLLVVILCFYYILAVYLFLMNWHYLISRLLAFSPFLFLFLRVVILCFYSILPVYLFLMKWYIYPPYVRCRYYIGRRSRSFRFAAEDLFPFSFFFFISTTEDLFPYITMWMVNCFGFQWL